MLVVDVLEPVSDHHLPGFGHPGSGQFQLQCMYAIQQGNSGFIVDRKHSVCGVVYTGTLKADVTFLAAVGVLSQFKVHRGITCRCTDTRRGGGSGSRSRRRGHVEQLATQHLVVKTILTGERSEHGGTGFTDHGGGRGSCCSFRDGRRPSQWSTKRDAGRVSDDNGTGYTGNGVVGVIEIGR